MRRHIVAAALAALLLPTAIPAEPRQLPPTLQWTIGDAGKQEDPGIVQFSLSYRIESEKRRGQWMHSNSMPLSELQGFTAAQYGSAEGAPVRFRLNREAGSFDCEGVVRRQRGTGDCRFLPDARFAAALAQRGIGTATPTQLFSLATSSIGLRYADELQRQGYARPTVDDLVRAGDHGANYDYLRSMGELGYRVGTLPNLIRMRDHGVSASYVRELVASGLKDIPADMLVQMRDHGVSPTFIGELRKLGYSNLPVRELIRLRDHGVSASFVRDLAGHGRRFSPDELVRLRDHGVSAAYVGQLRQLGYRDLTSDDLVRLRSHGVSADFVRRTNAGGRRSVDELVRQRTGG
jgi:hypothetical protein